MTRRISFALSVLLAGGVFIGLIFRPADSVSGAVAGLLICASVIIPSLFPFMVVGNLFSELGLTHRLAKTSAPLMGWLFGVSGAGGTAFLLGLTGGYPLGAMSVAQMHSQGMVEKEEAEHLLGFCNNCGPAFIIGVAGSTVFGSPVIGFFLYGVHITAAVLTGILLRFRHRKSIARGRKSALLKVDLAMRQPIKTVRFSDAFTESVKRATLTILSVCGFVVFFSVIVALLDAVGVMRALAGELFFLLGSEPEGKFTRSLFGGILELGTGVSSMIGLPATAGNLSLCAFILGWGGLSVHAQAAAVTGGGGLRSARHFLGKLLHGACSFVLTLLLFPVFF